MEHRRGGSLAQHFGEERILLFRSDQRGAIAKIIFSVDADEQKESGQKMAQAKIHVLSVKDFYRGYDLGGLMFSEAMDSLRQRYQEHEAGDQSESTAKARRRSFAVRCELDAEEDIRRHNKLVLFYEHLGCQIKPQAKISFINNNDGEMYRKVPMQIELHDFSHSSVRFQPLVNFLPVIFFSANRERIGLRNNPTCQNWLVVETSEGVLEFRSTTGVKLAIGADGYCTGKAEANNDHSKFRLHRVSDVQARVLDRKSREEAVVSKEARQKELWMIQSSNGLWLGLDSTDRFLVCTKEPAFWQAGDDDFSLTCTTDSPARRQHYRHQWSNQTVEYVHHKRTRYLKFSICRMSLKNALDLVRAIPGDIFCTGSCPSLRSLLYFTSELARSRGLPDWFQLIALIHGLGSALKLVDKETASDADQERYDWTICTDSRILGCKAPENATMSEFRCLNADEENEKYSSETGVYETHCGLENVLLLWIGSEYIQWMLKHNAVELPDEAFAVLRRFALNDWHTKQYHKSLTNEYDYDALPFVQDFNDLRREANSMLRSCNELTDQECDNLWDSHYARIAKKYGADGSLSW
eukprot:scaffold358_cov109-Cylindrotheca_fusiformis.AAC.1